MRALLTAVLLSTALVLPAGAQDMARITVTGECSVESRPDMATVSLGVVTRAPTAAAAMEANSTQLAAVIERLRAAGIEERDLQTTGLSLNPEWEQTQAQVQPRIAGYQAANQLTVRVRALDDLGGILDSTIKDGANSLNGLGFGLADPRPALDEARRRAVADAMARAKLLTEAAGLTLGAVVSITEGGGFGGPQPMYRMDAAAESAVPVAAGEIATAATVTMTFEIGQ